MAEYGDEERQEYGEGDDSLEDTTAASVAANNSIIGKVKSSVTSILPNSLSKWFSPSSNNNNDSANGCYVSIKRTRAELETNTPSARIDRRSEMARRRIEVNEYAEEEDDDGDAEGDGDDVEDDDGAEESDDAPTDMQRRRHFQLISPMEADQPPLKRSRMTLDGTMLMTRPLIASTPSLNAQRNSMTINHHCGQTNVFPSINRKEIGYNAYIPGSSASNFEQQSVAPDIIDLIPIPMSSGNHDELNAKTINQKTNTEVSRSRRTLNIPPTNITSTGSPYSSSALPPLKRQSLSSIKLSSTATDSRQKIDTQSYDKNDPIMLDPALDLQEVFLESQTYNGSVQSKFQNGATDFDNELRRRSVTDSEAEDGDTITEMPTNVSIHSTLKSGIASQRGASSGLFNMSTGNSRSGSRTSSFGNSLNFYTHLEGRKSLFAGNNPGTGTNKGNPLNSSTLSLNSLSRRQFNASIYGSTSALSDSRLLNTSSPFYKGNTTYGGAAAYSKYTTTLGSNSRLTPTLIRPTSSLSTLSSSSNSIAAGAGLSNAHGEQIPAISGTAKTILDLLNGFTTPLSEAKKMASSIRQQPTSSTGLPNAKSKRLSDADINTSRTMRLQQVRTPYMRPSVMLQPKKSSESQMPPVRELQVPSMSQLLQMKKLQTSTERSRQITMQKSDDKECLVSTLPSTTKTIDTLIETREPLQYTLPTTTNLTEKTTDKSVCKSAILDEHKQQKHVNKIKHKTTNPLRAPEIADESPPIPANLPNIAFPLMKEMPKIDIDLPVVGKRNNAKIEETEIKKSITLPSVADDFQSLEKTFKFSPPDVLKDMSSSMEGIEPSTVHFEFSKPAPLEETNSCIMPSKSKSDTVNVSPPDVRTALPPVLFAPPKPAVPNSVPVLKTGSVLDALKKPFVLPKLSEPTETVVTLTNTQSFNSFGSQFKKGGNEWECDTCMVRNKDSAQKCVACDVPRKGGSAVSAFLEKPQTPKASNAPTTIGFGNQFKKQTGEWECSTCLIRNKPELKNCVSCETPRKSEEKPSSQANATKPFGQSLFGNSLKPVSLDAAATSSDSGFKLLAKAQQASKWECEACMTRNDSSRSKCACCEQPKPGSESQKENAPSFNFGATAASKFTFGFGAGAPDPAKDNEIIQKNSDSSVNTLNVQKPCMTPSKGFTFGQSADVSTTQHNSFSFGLQTKSITPQDKTTTATTTEKDTADSSAKTSGFTFGFGNSTSPKASTTVTFSATTTKLELPVTSTATNQKSSMQSPTNKIATTTATTTIASFTPPKVPMFGFGNVPSTTISSSTSISAPTKSNEGLTSSLSFPKPGVNIVPSTTTNVSSSSSSKLSFPITTTQTGMLTTIASATVTSNVSGTTTTASPSFNFGIVSTSATSTTTPVKPMFSFKASPIPTTSTGNVSSSTLPLGSTSTTTTSVSGNIGLNFTNTTPSSLVPNAVSSTKSAFSITPNVNTNTSLNLNTFGTFGSTKSNNQTDVTIATTTSAPTFGGFSFGNTTATTAKIESGNLFGTSVQKLQEESKQISSTVPIFGNSTAQTEQKISTSNTWPKNTFLFGSSPNAKSNAGVVENALAPKAIFGSLKSESTESTTKTIANNVSSVSSIFGSANASGGAPNFGNNVTAPTAIFGTGSGSASTNTTNLFGTNNNTTLPQFGTINSGQTTLGNNPAAKSTPTLGNPTSVGFGSYAVSGNAAAPSSTTNSEPSTQPAVTPFTFGAPQTQTATGGFNFGATAGSARPAFNFTPTSQPTFNFSGSSTETTQNSARPFQFGATAAPNFNAPSVFNFGGAPSTETSSNAPFQFNAGSSPATSNIFAPAPTLSTTTQAARRKVRIPNRRLTPR